MFVVVNGEVITPPLSDGCLAGITRDLVVQWCDVSERSVPMSALATADEIFLTSSTRDVHPVHQVDERGTGRRRGRGPTQIAAVFADRSRLDPDPP